MTLNDLDNLLGTDCPHPNDLQTGDLLFPRQPGPQAKTLDAQIILASPIVLPMSGQATVRQYLARKRTDLGHIFKSGEPLRGYSPELIPRGAGMKALEFGPSKGDFDISDPANLIRLVKILESEFPDLIDKWLDMSMRDFMDSKIAEFLVESLVADDPRGSFFVGHLSMVVREEAGQVVTGNRGTAYVIEANVTDYSHYRVAIHPYHIDGETAKPTKDNADLMRGWAERRLALGENVCRSRPKALADSTGAPAERHGLQQALADKAKLLLGRPFGFFDHPEFGDIDHMYCAEYLFWVFREAGQAQGLDPWLIDDLRGWGWMKRYLAASRQTKLLKLVDDTMREQHFPETRKFFVLTPPMVWNSAQLPWHWSPDGEGPYATPAA